MLVFLIITPMKAKYSWPILIAGIPFTVLVLVAGFKLIKKQSAKEDSEKSERKKKGLK